MGVFWWHLQVLDNVAVVSVDGNPAPSSEDGVSEDGGSPQGSYDSLNGFYRSSRNFRMRVRTLAYIGRVTTPVDVFCWLGW